ncbi:TadE family type IV pilus minor pilin [Demequina sp. SO4-13]|uniref:TadE family type IV pilus minor pilin n=1 Tax=Demequina sp. SO4-13 TaxID=3401027 RepID=UPI003AF9F100
MSGVPSPLPHSHRGKLGSGLGGGWRGRPWRDRDQGSVTVELAAALPAVVIVLGLVLGAVGWARTGITATEAAAVGARIAAVEGADAARTEIGRSVPGAVVAVDASGGRVEVTVSIDGPGWLPAASATSVARVAP